MFCNGCGTTLQSGQRFCSQCGKELLGPIEAAQIHRGRVLEHIRLLGILWIAYSAFHVVGGLVLLILRNTIFLHGPALGGPPWVNPFMHSLFGFIGFALLLKAFLGLVAGWGLLQRESWARMLTIVLAFFSLFMNIPLGTALGIYTLWVLLPTKSEQEYDAASARVAR